MNRRRAVRFAAAIAAAACVAAFDARAADAAEAPIETLWRDTLDRSDYDTILETYSPVSALYDAHGEFDATRCAAQADALAASTATNPIGIAVWYAAWRCAEAAHDEALASQRLARVEALLRHAFASAPPDGGLTPIRVLAELDVDAVVEASGLTLIDSYYDYVPNWRYLPLTVTLWDEAARRERRLSFDYLDSWVRLKHDNEATRFPSFRRVFARNVLRTYAERKGSAAAYRQEITDANDAAPDKRNAMLADAARRGNQLAAYSLAVLCTMPRDPGCGTLHIDALLPYAERRYAAALAWLAQAYRVGAGVPRNATTARTLLDAADRRAGNAGGRIRLEHFERLRHDNRADPALTAAPIEAAARAGVLTAQLAVVRGAFAPERVATWSAMQRDAMRDAAQAGSPIAQYSWSSYLYSKQRDAEALVWLQRAADNDQPEAQAALARRYADGSGVARNVTRALYWFGKAGHGGDTPSMLWLGRHYRARQTADAAAAQGWLRSAVMAGSVDGKLELAQLYETRPKGVDAGLEEAAGLYREMASEKDNAEARRRLSAMLARGAGVARDPTEAERLLRGDAERGDAQSQTELGLLLLRSQSTRERLDEGVAWLRKAAPKDRRAQDRLATAIWYGYGAKRDPRAAGALWQRMVDAGDKPSINNYAWALCTSEDDAVVDGRKGVAVAQRIAGGRNAPLAWLDTLAACQAAAGDYEEAALTQQRIVDRLERETATSGDVVTPFQERLALYQANRRYTEDPGL